MACGLVIGWSWHDGLVDALAAVGLLLWLRFALIWIGLYLGLVAGKPESVMAVQILVWPLGFLSNAFSDPATMPGWLGTIAEWNPLSATVAATRELFGNPGWGGDSWVASTRSDGDRLAAGADRDLLPARGGEVPLALPLAAGSEVPRGAGEAGPPHDPSAPPQDPFGASRRGGAYERATLS